MTRRASLSIIVKSGLAAMLIGGGLAAAFQLGRQAIDRAGRWMPREADRQ